MKHIKEAERAIPVTAEYDVAVVGGGIAGVAAAVAAARNRVSVCIIEKQFALGGLATLGNVVVFLPLCDGCGRQVIKGLGEELLKLSVSDGYNRIPSCWTGKGTLKQRTEQRYRVTFNPASFILALEPFVTASGVEIMYDTRFCRVKTSGNSITHIIVETKEGRSAVKCRAVVDASGDADVCAAAGEETVSLKTNIAAGWFLCLEKGKLSVDAISEEYDPSGKTVPEGKQGFSGITAADVTRQVLKTRLLFRQKIGIANGKKYRVLPVTVPTIPGFRMTRRLKGRMELQESDDHKPFVDSIGMTGDWRKAGPVYRIPLGALAAVNTGNLITAGRCISSDSAWDVTRVIPACAVTGEAAGTAAALLCRSGSKNFGSLDVKKLQQQLNKQNVLL